MRRVLVVATALVLAGCGGGGGSSSGGPSSAADVAKLAGCTGFEVDADGQALAKEVGSCQLDGADIYVHVFTDDNQRDQWLEVAKVAGGSFVEGSSWVVQTMTTGAAAKVAEASGGKVVN